MSNWDYNCPKFVDFTNPQDNSVDSEYFEVDHEQSKENLEPPTSPDEDRKLEAPSKESFLQGAVSSTRLSVQRTTDKRRSSLLRAAAARMRAEEEETTAKKPKTRSVSKAVACVSPVILNKSPKRIMDERDDSLSTSVPRIAQLTAGRKRHASVTLTAAGVKKPTQPFHFATDNCVKGVDQDARGDLKRKREQREQLPFISLAEQVLAFQNHIPDRFRSKATHDTTKVSERLSPRLTRAVTPRLRTNLRSRPVYVKSQQDIEKEELEEMKTYKFTARPYDPKVHNHTARGIPIVKSKSATKPLDVHLATDKRASAWKKSEPEQEIFRFTANPAPKMRPLRAKHSIVPTSTTVPKSPAFALKLRSAAWQRHQEEMESKEETAKSAPVRKVQRAPTSQPSFQKTATVPVPFSFSETDKLRLAKKEATIKQYLEQEKRPQYVFRANPMPSPSPAVLPQKMNITLTKQEPFQMQSDQRGKKRADQWRLQVDEDMQEMKAATVFKAHPADVLNKVPFVPHKAEKPPTECTAVFLNTEKRASLREKYDEKRHQAEQELERLKAQREAEQEVREKELIHELRQRIVHVPLPLPNFDHPLSIVPSDKPLTVPQSPNFLPRRTRSSK